MNLNSTIRRGVLRVPALAEVWTVKGTITNCLAELVENKFGKVKWLEVLKDAGIASNVTSIRMVISDVPDERAAALLGSTCRVLGITLEQAADAFGEYWCCEYAPRQYKVIVRKFKNAREMILGMDAVHVNMTQTIANAHPPRFNYKWEDENTLIVEYDSKRNMIDIYIGLARGVGKYFNEKLSVSKLSPNTARIVFA